MLKKISLFVFSFLFLFTTLCESTFARAGGRSSFGGGRSSTSYFNQGSRGSRTFEGGGSGGKNYAPMQKTSATQGQGSSSGARQGQGAQNQGAAQNMGQNAAQPNRAASFFQRNPMLSTFGTVLAASWLGHMIFGNNNSFASGMNAGGDGVASTAGAGGGMLVNLLLMALGFFAVVMLVRYLTRGTSGVGAGAGAAQNNNCNTAQAQENRATISEIQLSESENKKFAEILVEVQNAWSNQDLDQLKKLTTPEILKYFSDSLRQNISQDIANKVENVELISIHTNESWREDEMEYATSILEWSAFDYMINLNKKPSDNDYIAQGNEKVMVITSEAWTFARYGSQGKWILSAIAQVE